MKTDAFRSTGSGCWSAIRSGGGDPSSRDGFYRLSVPRSPEGRCRLTILVLDSTWLGRFWLSLGTSLKNIFPQIAGKL